MNREYHRWYSERLHRDKELLVFGHSGEPVRLLPTSKGLFFQAEDFGLIGAIADREVTFTPGYPESSPFKKTWSAFSKLLRNSLVSAFIS
ncbi:hypothetical protein [Myxococcus xanthus]|uniref:hypothetical protein n=1 Tax=Myxococcus xanthus TaxID=34 RepID=UPI001F48B95F|nr:hypothetical protein [Myxococcus xanthus]